MFIHFYLVHVRHFLNHTIAIFFIGSRLVLLTIAPALHATCGFMHTSGLQRGQYRSPGGNFVTCQICGSISVSRGAISAG